MTQSRSVTLVDYGGGNIRSVVRALTHVGAQVRVSADPAVVSASERVALPGQGAFGECMRALRKHGLDDAIQSHLHAQRPFLGICLGLQILFERSAEDGEADGLGVFEGDVVHFQSLPDRKVPHMGWNTVASQSPMRYLASPDTPEWFYFVHSYYVPVSVQSLNPGARCAISEYGHPFVSAIEQDNLFASQFHPEKSQAAGLALLERFVQ